MKYIIPALLGLAIILFLGFILLSFNNYKKRFNVKYNPLNMFPYELNFEASFKDNLIGNIFLFATSLTGIVFHVLIIKSATSGFIIILAVSGILASVLLSIVPLLPLTFLKTPLIVDIALFISVLLSIVSSALCALRYYQVWLDSENNPSLFLMIFYFVFGGIYLLFLFNPKMALWAKLEQVVNSDGTSYYQRPKFFPLAYTEWVTYIFYFISLIFILVNYFTGII